MKTMASLQAFPSSLLPHARSRALIPFPFPFERLPRRLLQRQLYRQCLFSAWGLPNFYFSKPFVSKPGSKPLLQTPGQMKVEISPGALEEAIYSCYIEHHSFLLITIADNHHHILCKSVYCHKGCGQNLGPGPWASPWATLWATLWATPRKRKKKKI